MNMYIMCYYLCIEVYPTLKNKLIWFNQLFFCLNCGLISYSYIFLYKGETKMNRTDFLFAMPSFLGGAARVLDLGATSDIYNDSETVLLADLRALMSDWIMTGQDINGAMNGFKKDQASK